MYQLPELDLGQSQHLSDHELVEAFEACTLPPDRFAHADHVHLAFIYLGRYGLLETIRRYREGLQRFATHHGAAGRYHETVTWALVILIQQRMAEDRAGVDWPAFASANPDLMRFRDGAFFDYYGPEVLECETARRTFVLPEPTVHRPRGSAVAAGVVAP
jgi:hypothetical protein